MLTDNFIAICSVYGPILGILLFQCLIYPMQMNRHEL